MRRVSPKGTGGRLNEGPGRIKFIAFVAFLGSIGLMKHKRVEGSIPMALNNTINPKNTMNNATKFVVCEGRLKRSATGN